ncbi:unnamed protein product, partial [Iphiclides podalirius]
MCRRVSSRGLLTCGSRAALAAGQAVSRRSSAVRSFSARRSVPSAHSESNDKPNSIRASPEAGAGSHPPAGQWPRVRPVPAPPLDARSPSRSHGGACHDTRLLFFSPTVPLSLRKIKKF